MSLSDLDTVCQLISPGQPGPGRAVGSLSLRGNNTHCVPLTNQRTVSVLFTNQRTVSHTGGAQGERGEVEIELGTVRKK